jgi:hypothetical protein
VIIFWGLSSKKDFLLKMMNVGDALFPQLNNQSKYFCFKFDHQKIKKEKRQIE